MFSLNWGFVSVNGPRDTYFVDAFIQNFNLYQPHFRVFSRNLQYCDNVALQPVSAIFVPEQVQGLR